MKTKPGFNIRNVCGQDLIVAEGEENIDFSNIISMNETSSYLWTKVQKMDSFTVDDMVNLLLQEYEVDRATALSDCSLLAAQWNKAGIIDGDDIPDIDINDDGTLKNDDDIVVPGKPLESFENKETKKKCLIGRLFHKNR
jgi:hypothetical protein